ncbi:MAG: hypothetical protein WC421_06345 [Elusimicrobiales bacterium]
MNAARAEIGKKYITRTGIPVTVVSVKDGKISLKSATTGSVIRVNGDYELKPINDPQPSHTPKSGKKTAPSGKSGAQKPASLAAIIDPILLDGGHTVKEIAAELGQKAGENAKGKDLEANVRARLVSYKRKGWQVLKNGKQVQVIRK